MEKRNILRSATIVLMALFGVVKGKDGVVYDWLNFRKFNISEFKRNYSFISNERFMVSTQESIDNQEFNKFCKKKIIFGDESGVFFVHRYNPVEKACLAFALSRVKEVVYNPESKEIELIISEMGSRKPAEIGSGRIAYKLILFRRVKNMKKSGQKLEYAKSDAIDPYDRVIYQIPGASGAELRMEEFIVTSLQWKLLFSLPKLLFFLGISLCFMTLQLNQPNYYFPLYQLICSFNCFLLFFFAISPLEIENIYINSLLMALWILLITAAVYLAPNHIKLKISLYSNILIIFEIFLLHYDKFDNVWQFVGFWILAFVSHFLISVVFLKINGKMSKADSSDINKELVVGSMITIKITGYLFSASDPFRNPIFFLRNFQKKSRLNSTKKAFLGVLAFFSLCSIFALRTLIIILLKRTDMKEQRKNKEMKGEDYVRVKRRKGVDSLVDMTTESIYEDEEYFYSGVKI